MKGDFTRDTFKKEKHYASVRMQQGRVQLDADWNEELDINKHRVETETIDVVGDSGAPINNAGFKISASGNDLLIGTGRYYVSGILCENEEEISILSQPDIPEKNKNNSLVVLSDSSVSSFPPKAGSYLVYLDVWQRHLTVLEDPEIRESALGGPDTTTRIKTVWQVKLLETDDETTNDESKNITCLTELESWNKLISASTGTLSARAEEDEQSKDPCIIAPGAGYRRLENQLYRIEIHKPGQRGTATFKWSRDNGSIVVSWLAQDGNNLSVSSLGRDKYLGLLSGQWIELFDDSNELYNTTGTLVQIIKAADNVITIDPDGQTIDINNFPDNPRIRRWDSEKELLVTTPVANNGWLKIEDGVEIKFSEGNYNTGDYWIIPARTAKADVEWQKDDSNIPLFELPKGIKHFFARLAITEFDGDVWNIISDCRNLFPPLTELQNLFYVSGDGQEVMPDVFNPNQLLPLPKPLRVGVSNGSYPVENASVLFRILKESDPTNQLVGGKVSATGIPDDDEIIVTTNQNGIAECFWKLHPALQSQQVEAVLIDAEKTQIHLPIVFTANLSKASNVSYDPGKCENLKNAKTVQEAIDILCKMTGGRDPGIHVKGLRLLSGSELQNDVEIPVENFVKGIEIICDEKIEQDTVLGRPTCFVTLDLPYPLNDADRSVWDMFNVFGFQSLRLDALTNADNNSIFWNPSEDAAFWLRQRLFPIMKERKLGNRVLAHLTLVGNFIWNSENHELYLDGEVYGIRKEGSQTSPTMLNLPSGNGIKGGNFEMWFYLVPGRVESKPLVISSINFLNVSPALTRVGTIERQSSAGIVNPPVEPGTVKFKAGEGINVIEVKFNRAVKEDGLGKLGQPQSIRLDLFTDFGGFSKMFGDILKIDETTFRFILRDPGSISQPGQYRLSAFGEDVDSPAIRTLDDGSLLDGDYNSQAGGNFQLFFNAI